ncbi:MAG TPA: hypothetical protein VKA63_08405, partial [Candidatus Krumholzibacteria bacterium]|nr:hypothetical protein [Candidatus Krumholzibacteria bacterium]
PCMPRLTPAIRAVASLLMVITASACSDGGSPTADSGSCGNENVHCAYATVHAADWSTGVEYLDPPIDGTDYYGSADLTIANLENVSPGDEVYFSVNLSPPLVITSNVPPKAVVGFGGSLQGRNENVAARPALTMGLQGDWMTIGTTGVTLRGDRSTGLLSSFYASGSITGLSEGDELRGATFKFTIPEKWSDGTPFEANQTVALDRFGWGVSFSGDTRAETPPIQLKTQ